AFLRRLLHVGLAVPDLRRTPDRACAERLGCPGVFRRDRERQGPRRLPARRARTLRHHARLHRRRRPRARPAAGEGLTMLSRNDKPATWRVDHVLIAEMVQPGARVLDVGSGDGELLRLLTETKGVDGRGIEISREGVNASVAKGLAVIQGDADIDLAAYPDGAFDYVILSQTIQATRRPRWVLEQMLRIGKHVIVSFPNFGHWRIRFQLLRRGRMPITDRLNDSWYDTQNIHFCTIRDFVELVNDVDAKIERGIALDRWGRPVRLNAPWEFWNFFGEQGLFLLTRKG